MKNVIFKMKFVTLVFLVFFSCDTESDDLIGDEIQNETDTIRAESEIPESAIQELHDLIEKGAFDEEIKASRNLGTKGIGDGKCYGTIGFDLGTRQVTLNGLKTGELCPKQLIRGDREFGGGPLIYSTVALYYSNPHLYARITFQAKETKDDQSEVRLDQWVFLRSDILDVRNIATGTFDDVFYRGKNAGPEFIGCNDGDVETNPGYYGPVRYFKIIGDTGASDISSDDNCSCDTKIYNIEFDEIRFNL